MSQSMEQKRWKEDRGRRAVSIANCSGSMGDQGYQMLRQMTLGDVDFVTGDYLAELNLAQNVEAFSKGQHEGYEPTAWDGLHQSMETINEKRIKVVINGGALNPLGLAKRCQSLITEKGYDLKVAAVLGDDVLDAVRNNLKEKGTLDYLDSRNDNIRPPKHLHAYLDQEAHPLVSAHAYLGARGIVKALENGASIVICGRVADASPVIGAAQYWFDWSDKSYDQLAGGLVAGHLIECSAYVTGSNFAGFDKLLPETLFDLPFGIAEVEENGSCIITKPENTSGIVSVETVKCQLLYEIQGSFYLNSDVKAYLHGVLIEEVAPNRIKVHGARGAAPPPTTKLAVAYKGGFQAQLMLNLGGYAVSEKHAFYEKQIRYGLEKKGLSDKFDELVFQIVGTAAADARTMLASTTYLRIFVAASTPIPIGGLLRVFVDYAMQHVSGAHGSTDLRAAMPLPYLSYFPALFSQSALNEKVLILDPHGEVEISIDAGHPPMYEDVEPRASYDVPDHWDDKATTDFGPCRSVPLGDVALARSGDKGSNVNIGLFVSTPAAYAWFRSYMTRDRMRQLMGDDWRDDYYIERVEFPTLFAVHFVIYGILGRGVSSTSSLDSLGKGFADWIRSRHCEVPIRFLYSR